MTAAGPWVVRLDLATPSLNSLLRLHWAARKRTKAVFGWLLISALSNLPKIPAATGPRKLIIERHGRQALDADNLAGGCKGLIDCVKSQRLILDDNPAACLLEFRQVVHRNEPAFTVLILEDLAQPNAAA